MAMTEADKKSVIGGKSTTAALASKFGVGGTPGSWNWQRCENAAVQIFLAKDGFSPGPIDGIIGPLTEAAFERWSERSPQEPSWVVWARQYLGLAEVPGRLNNPKIIDWWRILHLNFTDDETPWCAAFVGAMLEEVGYQSTRSGAARSYLNWGVPLKEPMLGCIVVFSRGPRNGHVGFVLGKDKRGNLIVLGGNQDNKVCIKPFGRGRVLGYRWPAVSDLDLSSLEPLPLLKSTGEALSENEA